MRVTYRMQVNNMLTHLNRRAEKMYNAETIVATGKGINTLSDDPLAAGHIIKDCSTVSRLGKYQSNMDQARTYITYQNNVLESAIEMMEEACGIATEESAADLTTREPLVEQLKSYYDTIVDLANTELENDFIYSGTETDTMPFVNETTVSGGMAEDILFDLADNAAAVTIDITDRAGDVVRTLTVPGGTAGTNSVAWNGLDDFGAAVVDGEYEYNVTAVDASGDEAAVCHTYRGGDACKTVVMNENSTLELNNDGGDVFSETLMALQEAITAMERTTFDPSELSALLDDLNGAIHGLKTELVALSVKYARLETNEANLDESLVILEEHISKQWSYDADQAVVELQTLETAYEITMETTSMLLNMPNLIGIL